MYSFNSKLSLGIVYWESDTVWSIESLLGAKLSGNSRNIQILLYIIFSLFFAFSLVFRSSPTLLYYNVFVVTKFGFHKNVIRLANKSIGTHTNSKNSTFAHRGSKNSGNKISMYVYNKNEKENLFIFPAFLCTPTKTK